MKETENKEEKQEKVLTKYDLKMQKRAEEKKKAKKEERVGMIAGILLVVALFCLVISFPIRTYLTVNGTYVKVAGENISRVEFDYNYNMVKNDYYMQNAYYLSMFGVDLSGDLATTMYSETLSWKDYFEQMTVESIVSNKALMAAAKAEGFTYDVAEDYAEYKEILKKTAAEAGVTEKEYIKQSYGTYATEARIKEFVIEGLELAAYYEKIATEKEPTEADIQAYYEENADEYDSVDYKITVVNAELPTEPTELADPVEETDTEEEAAEGETAEEEAYQPSEAEIEQAMKLAKEKAEEALKNISTEGKETTNATKATMVSDLQDWMFDAERKAGDTTIIENTTSHLYYVVEYGKRYRDEAPTIDARIIILGADAEVGADAVLEEWKNGAATEESFAEIADKYDGAVEGGFYEGLITSGLPEDLANWLDDSARAKGDTTVISAGENAGAYVAYYVGTNRPNWSLNIESTLLQKAMSEYMQALPKTYEIEDKKGNLNYLKVQEAEAASSEEASEGSEEATESTAE